MRIPSSMNSVLDYFHIRLPVDLIFYLYLTRFHVSLKIQDVRSTCHATSAENGISNRYQIISLRPFSRGG